MRSDDRAEGETVAELVGVTLADPWGCVPALHIPLVNTVLFGKNGAGKSTVLRNVERVLRLHTPYGAESADLLHVRVRQAHASPETLPREVLSPTFARPLEDELAAVLGLHAPAPAGWCLSVARPRDRGTGRLGTRDLPRRRRAAHRSGTLGLDRGLLPIRRVAPNHRQ